MICTDCRNAADNNLGRQHHCGFTGEWCTCQHKVPDKWPIVFSQ